MLRRSLRKTWILQILMVVLTIMGVGIDAIPVSLLLTASATESDLPFAPDSEDGQDEATDGPDDLALPRAGENAYGRNLRPLQGSLAPKAVNTGRSLAARRARRRVGAGGLDIPTRLCRLTC